jgi:hypothetical protein
LITAVAADDLTPDDEDEESLCSIDDQPHTDTADRPRRLHCTQAIQDKMALLEEVLSICCSYIK